MKLELIAAFIAGVGLSLIANNTNYYVAFGVAVLIVANNLLNKTT